MGAIKNKTNQGRSVSTFRYPEDDRLILHLIGEMAEKGIRANDSQIIRAALRALDQLPLEAAAELVTGASESDKRRGSIKPEMRQPRNITDLIRKEIFIRDKCCQLCGTTERLCVDHVIAIANGGTNDMDNLQALCYDCNRSKGVSE